MNMLLFLFICDPKIRLAQSQFILIIILIFFSKQSIICYELTTYATFFAWKVFWSSLEELGCRKFWCWTFLSVHFTVGRETPLELSSLLSHHQQGHCAKNNNKQFLAVK